MLQPRFNFGSADIFLQKINTLGGVLMIIDYESEQIMMKNLGVAKLTGK